MMELKVRKHWRGARGSFRRLILLFLLFAVISLDFKVFPVVKRMSSLLFLGRKYFPCFYIVAIPSLAFPSINSFKTKLSRYYKLLLLFYVAIVSCIYICWVMLFNHVLQNDFFSGQPHIYCESLSEFLNIFWKHWILNIYIIFIQK